MTPFSVLLGVALLIAMSADGSGVKDQIDPELTTEVETLVAQSPLREFAGLAPIAAEPAPVPYIGTPFVEIPLVVESNQVPGFLPLTDLDALYGLDGPPVVQVQPAPPVDLVDDTPVMIASAWDNPPLDAK